MDWNQIKSAFGFDTGGETRTFLDALRTALGLNGGRGDQSAAFTMAVIALCAKMAKADGVVVQVEADAFEQLFRVPHDEIANVRRLFDLAKSDIAGYETYASQIGRLLKDDKAVLRDLLECLFHIAAADGILHEGEEIFLGVVAERFGITTREYGAIRSLFVRDTTGPYAVLGVTPAASDDEIRARHRALVLEHHPDRLTGHGVPPEFVTMAERKLAAINAAWDVIRKERGL